MSVMCTIAGYLRAGGTDAVASQLWPRRRARARAHAPGGLPLRPQIRGGVHKRGHAYASLVRRELPTAERPIRAAALGARHGAVVREEDEEALVPKLVGFERFNHSRD